MVITESEAQIRGGREAVELQPHKAPETPEPKFKKKHFCRNDNIKRFI